MGILRDAHDLVQEKVSAIETNFPDNLEQDKPYFDGQLTYGELLIVLDALKKSLDH